MEKQTQNEKVMEKAAGKRYKKIKEGFWASVRAAARTFAGAYRAVGALRGKKEGARVKEKTALILILSLFGMIGASCVIAQAAFPLRVYPAGFALLGGISFGWETALFKVTLPRRDARALELTALLALFSGVLISCLFLERGFFFLLFYLILFLTRAGVTGGKFNDSPLSRVTIASLFSVAAGILFSFLEGFSVQSVFAATSYGVITPLFTYLFCGFGLWGGAVPASGAGAVRRKSYLTAAGATGLYLFLYAIRDWEIDRFSISFVLAVMLTLAAARLSGPLPGAAIGLVGAMAAAPSALAPSLAVAGFFAGLFFAYSAPVALMISFVAAAGYSMIAGGMESFGLFTSDFLMGVVFFLPFIPVLSQSQSVKTRFLAPAVPRRAGLAARKTLQNMSEAFTSLSEVFYTVSDTMKKPSPAETSRLVSDCAAELCSGCALSGICWEEKKELGARASALLAARLLAKGKVDAQDLDGTFFEGCKKKEAWVELVCRRYDAMSGQLIKNKKTSLLAGEYSSVARLLKNTAGSLESELEYNPSLEARAKKVLKGLGIAYRRVTVFGKRELKIDVYGVSIERIGVRSDRLLEAFEKEFDCLFAAPQYLLLEESVVLRLVRKRRIALECAKSGCTKKGETISGDTVSYFETDRDLFYTLLCDGMGSGREAAFTSRLASIFIEKLMTCATPKSVTLEMLNTFLMSKTDETFTTVDLLEIDLLSGEGRFIKAGAAPSFVLRGNRLHRIASRTPPAGVLQKMCAEETRMTLRPGDFILLLSDGALAGEEDAGHLVEILSGMEFENAAALCEAVFRAARERTRKRDDLSVSAIRVMPAG